MVGDQVECGCGGVEERTGGELCWKMAEDLGVVLADFGQMERVRQMGGMVCMVKRFVSGIGLDWIGCGVRVWLALRYGLGLVF